MAYNRTNAIEYAQKFALKRNPNYFDFSNYGGDCTNFISQCLLAGNAEMVYNKETGWFYESSFNRSYSWTSVEFLHNFLIRRKEIGLNASVSYLNNLELGDLIQIKADNSEIFTHTLIITKIINDGNDITDFFVCAHSQDSLNRNLSTFIYNKLRFLKIHTE